jgi:hypothetical protein
MLYWSDFQAAAGQNWNMGGSKNGSKIGPAIGGAMATGTKPRLTNAQAEKLDGIPRETVAADRTSKSDLERLSSAPAAACS